MESFRQWEFHWDFDTNSLDDHSRIIVYIINRLTSSYFLFWLVPYSQFVSKITPGSTSAHPLLSYTPPQLNLLTFNSPWYHNSVSKPNYRNSSLLWFPIKSTREISAGDRPVMKPSNGSHCEGGGRVLSPSNLCKSSDIISPVWSLIGWLSSDLPIDFSYPLTCSESYLREYFP
jgi:hypothetical protein